MTLGSKYWIIVCTQEVHKSSSVIYGTVQATQNQDSKLYHIAFGGVTKFSGEVGSKECHHRT